LHTKPTVPTHPSIGMRSQALSRRKASGWLSGWVLLLSGLQLAAGISSTCTTAISQLQQLAGAVLNSFEQANSACVNVCNPAASNIACEAECSEGLADLEVNCHDAAADVYQQVTSIQCIGGGVRETRTYTCYPAKGCSAGDIDQITQRLSNSTCTQASSVPWVTSCQVTQTEDDTFGQPGTGATIAGVIFGLLGLGIFGYICFVVWRWSRRRGGTAAESAPMLREQREPGLTRQHALVAIDAATLSGSRDEAVSSASAGGSGVGGVDDTISRVGQSSAPPAITNYQLRMGLYKGAQRATTATAAPALPGAPIEMGAMSTPTNPLAVGLVASSPARSGRDAAAGVGRRRPSEAESEVTEGGADGGGADTDRRRRATRAGSETVAAWAAPVPGTPAAVRPAGSKLSATHGGLRQMLSTAEYHQKVAVTAASHEHARSASTADTDIAALGALAASLRKGGRAGGKADTADTGARRADMRESLLAEDMDARL